MAGIKLVTDREPDQVLQIAWRTAQDLGFGLTPIQNSAFRATKGNTLLSLVAGAITVNCQFTLTANRYGDGTTDLVLERATSWTNGLVGSRRTKGEADVLMQKVGEAIEQNGGKVVERKEI